MICSQLVSQLIHVQLVSLSNEGEKNKNKQYYNLQHHADQKTIFKWHDDLTLTWNIKEIKLKLQQELSNNLSNHNS